MRIHHIAIWTFRLEELKDFYVRFLGGTSNEKYINPKKGFESYFISFDEGPTLELMSRVIQVGVAGLMHPVLGSCDFHLFDTLTADIFL